MSANNTPSNYMPSGEAFKRNLAGRNRRGGIWGTFYYLSLVVAIIALIALFLSIINQAFGYVVEADTISPTELVEGGDLSTLDSPALAAILLENVPGRLIVYTRDTLSRVSEDVFTRTPLREAVAGSTLPAGTEDLDITDITAEQRAEILGANLGADVLVDYVTEDVVEANVERAWSLFESIPAAVTQLFGQPNPLLVEAIEEYPDGDFYFRSWLTLDFITSRGSDEPTVAGIRIALLGTIWVIIITLGFAFPVGVGAAIYLQEYATDTPLNRLIETNIRNLAGVPSIIYGLLGLAIFARALSDITGGRTILSAGLTLGLLILPVIIINSQEALRAVPSSIREASYGVGATKWQTIWNQVLPAAMPGILTGTILASSRALGETAPLIVVGASTTIFRNPLSIIDKFTVLPIQIFDWTSRPQAEFRAVAAAAIIVLIVLLLLLNTTAIILRQRFRKSLQG
ncbi:MAG: phosphate ABC transporter permease PstA [Chloroflexota bacterium]|nr:phosphate ABC transporter permease PstA [Chloroflexota bacterium]